MTTPADPAPSLLRTVQRRFTSGRLARRFAFVSLMLGVLLAVLIGASLYLVSSRHLIRQHHGNIEANAALVARQTEGLLTTLVDTVRELSDNSVLASALVDSAGKEAYLLPFLRSFNRIASVPVALVFTDFEGVPIADNGQRTGQWAGRLRMTPEDMAWLVRSMATGQPAATVVWENGVPFLLAAEMLIYSRTASPEGALLYKVPLSTLVLHPEAELRPTGAPPPPMAEGAMAVEVPLSLPEHLRPLRLTLRLEAPATPSAAFQSWVLPFYGLVALLSLVALYFGSRAVGNHMTRSLRDLEQLAGAIASDGFTGQRARVRGNDEVSGLARTFNAMLDHIGAIQHEREMRAVEEITVQRTLAERAEQARNEAESSKNEAERARQEAVMALMVAERANAAKTHFLAAASHDLRQPVQSLVLLTSALAARLGDHPASSLVGSIETSMEALCRLLDAILDVSKLDAGTVSPNVQAVSLGAIFERLDAEYRLRAAEKGIGFRSVPNSLTLCADPALLERIIRNLVENALRYTDSGRILLGCRRGPSGLRIQVFDTGIGIPPEHLERIFHEFYQVSNPARDRGKGLGLGLAIVDRLARLLGYRVHVASWPGKGSCFTLEIGDLMAPPLEAEMAVSADPVAPDPSGGTALVIDDDPLVREGLSLLIEGFGWRVLAADGASGALRVLAESGRLPDLVIADYRLADHETGLDVIRAVESAMAGRPPLCVVLTGDTAPERIADAEASGYRILHKPIGAKDIALLLNEAAIPTTTQGRPERRSRGPALIGG
ncbi:signal transduction histidine kinase/CheY-like chemotaxis protein [Azospirillum agricola]|uniref:hybrid sensor histidine kinase/response regulator n=1 Tax=Azospirillum agricola TaxID=1720247 RepID=UPI001AE6D986|nr:hybrid sensor histidine kinase/response regulator [Azospirillum agricola]MBP2232129.1 signal transduction histidine kinase/CheY-like chemotaxis protein [Azospirillum agricola]